MLPEEQMRSADPAYGPVGARLVEEEQTPLSLVEKDQVINEVWTRFSAGPAGAVASGPDDIGHSRTHAEAGLRRARRKAVRTPVEFKDNAHLIRIIEKVVSRVGRRVGRILAPWSGRPACPDGSRVNAVVPPVAVDGPILSIRRFGRVPLTDKDMVRNLTLTEG